MKKFKFQLETLLKVTKRKKEDAELKFAEVSRRLEEEQKKLEILLKEMKQGQTEYAELTGEGKRVTIGVIMTYNAFFNWKRQQIEEQQRTILKTNNEKQKRLKELMKLMTYLKSIEQLKEKRFREYNEEVLFEEQKMLDEIGLQLYVRS
ncbi:MAG: flagellar export protein FliJ [Selenomonadaceae bacterium]|nr:flagellar export protein FliJ [Selenomonadaceae bacterium]